VRNTTAVLIKNPHPPLLKIVALLLLLCAQIFKSLDERVQVKAVTGCCVNIMILTIIGIPLVGLLFHRYKAAVKEWLDEINTK
jgi:EamA domain-containing membrane protein RarD